MINLIIQVLFQKTYVCGDDIIIGKVFPITPDSSNKDKIYRDSSTALRANESGYIDKIYLHTNNEGHRFCKVRVRSERIPTVEINFQADTDRKGLLEWFISNKICPY